MNGQQSLNIITYFRPTLSNTVLTIQTHSENKQSWRKSGKPTGIFILFFDNPQLKSHYCRSPKPLSPPLPELQYSRSQPLVGSSQHNTRLGSSSSPTFFFNNSSSSSFFNNSSSSSSSSPLMSPNSSGYFSHTSSPTYSCYSSPVRQQQQQVQQQQSVHPQQQQQHHQQLQTNESIVYENLIKLLQYSS